MSNYIIHNGTLMTEELYHYGVKGMKWGVRKAKKYDGKAARAENPDTKAKQRTPSKKTKAAIAKTVVKGTEVASKLMLASAVDDVFYGGVGKKIAKETVIQTGRAAVTAYTMARGGYDIKWYDKNGRRVG